MSDKFAIEITQERYDREHNEWEVKTTHNGYQWTAFNLSPSEMRKLAEALLAKLAEIQQEARPNVP